MKFSKMFIPTTKETPNDASLYSHQYLVRGGFIEQTGAGIYDFMPLGKIVLEKIKQIVKEEMDNSGANEVQFGFVTPFSFWEESGRSNTMGNELLKFQDRKSTKYVLSPTNEESVVNMVKNKITSYKELPIHLYQINTKFRDEARPRFGLLRGREFLMKDGYSFHSSQEDLVREFNVMEETYKKIYTRLGVEFRIVDADSGAIGGSGSKEFHILASSGEDTIVICNSCDYAANVEAAKRVNKTYDFENLELAKVLTPNCKTINDLCNFLKIPKEQTIKAVIKKAIFENKSKVIVFFIRGNDELEETKACNSVNAFELVNASDEDIKQANLVPGYCGMINLSKDVDFVVDLELKDCHGFVCGANEENYHFANVNLSTIQNIQYFDLVIVKEGDSCAYCSGKLSYKKGIEAGHIFQLGTKYSKAMNANFLDENGKSKPFYMGCYGIGISRLIAAIIEQNHDEKGCIWTKSIAPFLVDIIVSNSKKEEEAKIGQDIYDRLTKLKISAILDDRINARFGFKMSDFELLGFPFAIIIGKKLQEGLVEIIDRKTLQKIDVELENIEEKINKLIN